MVAKVAIYKVQTQAVRKGCLHPVRSVTFSIPDTVPDRRMILLTRLPFRSVNFAPAPARPGIHLTDQTVIT